MGEGAVVGALGGIDAALQAGEGIAVVVEDLAQRRRFTAGNLLAGDLMGPQIGLDTAETAELPVGGDEGIDEEALEGGGGLELAVVFREEGFELGGIFPGNDLRLGIDTGLERVETGDGFALRSAGAGRELRIATIRLDLTNARHMIGRL